MVFKIRTTSLFLLLNFILYTTVTSHNPQPSCPPLKPNPPPSPIEKPSTKCPTDTLKFGVCGSWLGLVYEVVGSKPSKECCSLIKGVADLEAAMCLCSAIKANVLGDIKFEVPVAISLVVNSCGKKVPHGFTCA